MFKYYLYFMLCIVHLSLFSILTCYISLDQNRAQHSYAAHWSRTERYKNFHNLCSENPNFSRYSTLDFKNYFNCHSYSQENILACNALYMSDEFVQLVKTFSGYQCAVKKLYHTLSDLGGLRKFLRIGYCPRLFSRISNLYKQIKSTQKFLNKQGEQFADVYNINLIELFPYDGSIDAQHMYENYMGILSEVSFISRTNNIIPDCIGQAAKLGLEANKNGHLKQASAVADFCWNLIDLTKAFGEGICLGALNTIDLITHPGQTIKNSLIGIEAIAYGLGALTAEIAECGFLYTVNSDRYYIKQEAIVDQLNKVIKGTQKYLQTTPKRDLVKQGSAFITEGILFSKICTFGHSTAKRLQPLVKNYVEYIAKTEPAALLADGTVYVENIAEQLLPKNIFNKIKSIKTQKLKPLGRGNTGRTVPNNLHEQLVMEQIIADPDLGSTIKIYKGMTDFRWPKFEGWVKKRWKNNNIHIHFIAQEIDGVIVAIDDFKFKDNLSRSL